MKENGWGRIVNISSGAGRSVSLTGIQAYATAKAAQIGFTRQMAHELGQYGITVNCIAPGFVLSNPSTIKQWESYGPEGQEKLKMGIATRRLGKAEDIANGVSFFVSEESDWVTGPMLIYRWWPLALLKIGRNSPVTKLWWILNTWTFT
jgi:3-oxoacyl-[acyl-carrier protein] reductase